ncbi:MAG: type II secretion system F family protein [Candidatus Aenigmatarchaeota archaeon]
MDMDTGIDDVIEWLTKTEKREVTILMSFVVGTVLIALNFIFLRDIPGLETFFPLINIVGVLLAIGPSMLIKYRDYRRKKEIERRFPDFLRDVTQGTRAGMTLPSAIEEAAEGDYGVLNPHVRKMASQMDWGVPFDEVLKKFADSVGSPAIRRSITTIIETHRSGGNVSDVLEVVAESVTDMERIKKERKSHVYSQMITGYTIYFIFLGVMVGLQRFLIPSLAIEGGAEMAVGGAGLEMDELAVIYEDMFQNLVIIQGFFSGLAIGKMSSGSIMAGLQHVLVLIVIGYSAFFVFI